MALGELLVSLAAVKRWVLLLQIQSSRTGRLVPVWIGSLHPDNQLAKEVTKSHALLQPKPEKVARARSLQESKFCFAISQESTIQLERVSKPNWPALGVIVLSPM